MRWALSNSPASTCWARAADWGRSMTLTFWSATTKSLAPTKPMTAPRTLCCWTGWLPVLTWSSSTSRLLKQSMSSNWELKATLDASSAAKTTSLVRSAMTWSRPSPLMTARRSRSPLMSRQATRPLVLTSSMGKGLSM